MFSFMYGKIVAEYHRVMFVIGLISAYFGNIGAYFIIILAWLKYLKLKLLVHEH